jgi:sugar lactone lactonase YvrE
MRRLLSAMLIFALVAPAPGEGPVTHATREFTLAEADLIPESIAYDAASSRWLVSSVRQARIVGADGRLFARAPWPVFALAIDASRRILWASTAVVPQCAVCADTRGEHSALIAYKLDSGAELRRIVSPVGGVLGDMVLAPNGDLFVSEGIHGAVFRLPQGGAALERLDKPGDFHSPQTPALSADGKTLFVPDYDRGIAALTLASRELHWLQPPAGMVLKGIDGLYIDGQWFIAIQNGVVPERIVRISLDLKQLQVLESGWPGLGEPTHGALVGRRFYFLANSGWDAFDAQGRKRNAAPPVVSSVWSFALGGAALD